MKVKIGDLKTHLSRYVQGLRDGGEPIEVCVREKPVAYLTANARGDGEEGAEARDLKARLEGSGITLAQWGAPLPHDIRPGRAADGRTDLDSVNDMRKEKPW